MEYNTTRTKLLMPEYGRNVQKMIEYLVTIDNRLRRLRNAEVIIELMGTLNPNLKLIEDYKHKLWDHLYQMTDFKLDVDSPYPRPTAEDVFRKPERIPYSQGPIKHRHLGKNIQKILDRAIAETNPEKRQGFTQAVGYYMKLSYANWHKEPVHDDMVRAELLEISGGQLKYEMGGYRIPIEVAKPNPPKQRNGNNNNNNNRSFKTNQGSNQSNNRNNSGYRDNLGGGGYGNNNRNNKKFKKK